MRIVVSLPSHLLTTPVRPQAQARVFRSEGLTPPLRLPLPPSHRNAKLPVSFDGKSDAVD